MVKADPLEACGRDEWGPFHTALSMFSEVVHGLDWIHISSSTESGVSSLNHQTNVVTQLHPTSEVGNASSHPLQTGDICITRMGPASLLSHESDTPTSEHKL